MRKVLIPAMIATVLASSSFAFAAAEHAIGAIKALDLKASTVTLADGKTYELPKGFKDPGLKTGEKIDITWAKIDGKDVATAVTIVK